MRTWVSGVIVADDGHAAVLWEIGPANRPSAIGIRSDRDED